MILAARFIAVLLLLASTPALAWAPEGHQIVAGIAARELTPKARAQVSALLGGEASAMMGWRRTGRMSSASNGRKVWSGNM